MPLNLKKQLGKGKIVLLILPNEKYTKYIIQVAKYLCENHPKICYVSLNKLYQALIKTLKDNKIDVNKFYFIDAITATAQPSFKLIKNCKFVRSPSALTELNLAITQSYKKHKSHCLLFDSLSTLLIYQKGLVVIHFTHSLINQMRAGDCGGYFTCLEGDTEAALIKDLGMFVDKVVRLK